jgi:hypothetical protein
MRKEKKKEKRKALPAARRPRSPLEPAFPFFSRGWAVGAEPVFPFPSRARMGRPRSRCCRTLSLPCFADERTPHVSHALLPLAVTEPETEAVSTKSTEETGISYPKTSYWSYKEIAMCSLVPFSI